MGMISIRKFKACEICFRLFQQAKFEKDDAFEKRKYCKPCSIVMEAKHSKVRMYKQEKKLAQVIAAKPEPKLAEAMVERTLEKPERKKPEILKKKAKRPSAKVTRYFKMNSIKEACAVYARMNNMPYESAAHLWNI